MVQNGGRVTANLGAWDGDVEIHEGDVVIVADAGAHRDEGHDDRRSDKRS